ncbi:MAG: DUF2828 family protein [Lachnospiraceae bacterium]|nr:DUF2828 family protein [Lachnospiraceae bacterium]
MSFAELLKREAAFTRTENGAVALNTTGDACLDLFGCIGALRGAEEARIERLFADAYGEDALFATKLAFYGRDVRGGLGERRTFRVLLRYMAQSHPEALRANLDLIGVYGRYDDLYELTGTQLEEDMWAAMKLQFEEDRRIMEEGHAISLLAKWIKTADASSEKTRKLGILTAQKLGYSVYEFKRIVRRMRKHIGVVEALMSAGKWDEISYSSVPSRAMMIYRSAFYRHDEERFAAYVDRAVKGVEKIHSATLFPYDIVEKYLSRSWNAVITKLSKEESDVLEAQWRALPGYVDEGVNAIVMADVSGSMMGRPMASSLGLALYFAEHNKGDYHNLFMSFSNEPQVISVKGETLEQKLASIARSKWGMNTDLNAAFRKILELAVNNHTPAEDMVKSIIVISDMEIDQCGNRSWTFYDKMREKYRKAGYEIPNVIFWNVNSRHDIFHADGTRKGVQLCSGQSAATFKQLLSCIGLTPLEAMKQVIECERYDAIRISA